MPRKIPPVLVGGLCALGVITMLSLINALAKPTAASIATVLANVAVIIGLYHGHRWAFVFAIVSAAFGTVFVLAHDLGIGVIVFVVNAMVIVPLLLCREFFFADRA
jgi:uncharacterized membrane protein (DUF2068 family)